MAVKSSKDKSFVRIFMPLFALLALLLSLNVLPLSPRTSAYAASEEKTTGEITLDITGLEVTEDKSLNLALHLQNSSEEELLPRNLQLRLSRKPFTSVQSYQDWLAADYAEYLPSATKISGAAENTPAKTTANGKSTPKEAKTANAPTEASTESSASGGSNTSSLLPAKKLADFAPTVPIGQILLPLTQVGAQQDLNFTHASLPVPTPGVYGIEISDPAAEIPTARGVVLWQLNEAAAQNPNSFLQINAFAQLSLDSQDLEQFLNSDLEIEQIFNKIPVKTFKTPYQDADVAKAAPMTWVLDPVLLNAFKEENKTNTSKLAQLQTDFKQHEELFFGTWGSPDKSQLAVNEINYLKALRANILKKYFPENSDFATALPSSNLLASTWLKQAATNSQALAKLRGLSAIASGICQLKSDNEDEKTQANDPAAEAEANASQTGDETHLLLSLPVNEFSQLSGALESLAKDPWNKLTPLKRSQIAGTDKAISSDKKPLLSAQNTVKHPNSIENILTSASPENPTESLRLAAYQSDLERISADAAHIIFPLRERLILSYSQVLNPQQQEKTRKGFNTLLNRTIEALSAQTSSQINLISDRGELPVKVANQLPIPVSVVVNVAPPEKSLRALKQIPVTLAAHESTTVKIPVQASADLRSQASVWLNFPPTPATRALGEMELAKSALTQVEAVNSTHYGTTQTIVIKVNSGLETKLFFGLSGTFLLFLLLIGSYKWRLGRKKRASV